MKQKFIELLAYDKNHELQYLGKCKLKINNISSMLFVEHKNDEHEMITAMFKWTFIIDNNILFVLGENELNDFALIFDEEKRCKKVYDFVCKEKTKNVVKKEVLYNRFLVTLCKMIASKKVSRLKLKKKCYDYFFFRRKNPPNSVNVAIYHPINKKLCFRLARNKSSLRFQCHGCKNNGKFYGLTIQKDEDGKEFFYHDYKRHTCKPIKVSSICAPEFDLVDREDMVIEIRVKAFVKNKLNNESQQLIKLPNFELSHNRNGIPDGSLFIFHSEERTLCYRHFHTAENKSYYCSGKKRNRCRSYAKVHVAKNGEKYVVLLKNEHNCELLEYEKIVDYGEKIIISAPDFITVSANRDDDKVIRIIVFTSPQRIKCYEFGPTVTKNSFICLDE